MTQSILKFLLLILLATCVPAKKKSEQLSQQVSMEINTEKGRFEAGEFIRLFVNVTNQSKEDITMLKPSRLYGYQMDFFYSKMECSGIGIMQAPYETPLIMKKESDLVVIEPKSEHEFEILGHRYELICDGDEMEVAMGYDTDRLSDYIINKFSPEQQQELMGFYNRLTKIKIESETKTIQLN